MQLTVNQIAAIRTCLHHTIRRFEEKSVTSVNHCGAVPQIECGGINVTAEIMEVLAVAEASLTASVRAPQRMQLALIASQMPSAFIDQREMLPEVF